MPANQARSAELLVAVARGAGPLQRQVEDQLRAAIRDGRLAAGERLPSSRVLAADLGRVARRGQRRLRAARGRGLAGGRAALGTARGGGAADGAADGAGREPVEPAPSATTCARAGRTSPASRARTGCGR